VPAFDEPWEARAFAMVRALQDEGLFTPGEWSDALGAEIRRAQAAGNPDTGETYYHHWLGALEVLFAEKNLVSTHALASCRTAWARAAERTPHGLPIELCPDDFDD
jgi:nitrile hydratase accessory protein